MYYFDQQHCQFMMKNIYITIYSINIIIQSRNCTKIRFNIIRLRKQT